MPNSITLVKKKRIIKAAKATAGSAINVLLASKVSLFTTNHHIGQGRLNTVMSKILGSIHVRLASRRIDAAIDLKIISEKRR